MMIRAIDVKNLRERTGAAMMECKRALEQSSGDQETAAALLKERGLIVVKKREERETNAGRLFLRVGGPRGAIVKLLCETDFVAMNREFVALGQTIAEMAIRMGGEFQGGAEVSGLINGVIARIRERIVLASVLVIDARDSELLSGYLHPDGTIAAIVRVHVDHPGPEVSDVAIRELAGDLALHVAACGPQFIARSMVPGRYIAELRDAFQAEAEALGKPGQLIQTIVNGKLMKRLGSICLLEQPFVRDENQSVDKILATRAGKIGTLVSVSGFLYDTIRDQGGITHARSARYV